MSEYDQMKFMSYEPAKKKLEIGEDGRTWDYGRTPEWWEKVRHLEGHRFAFEDHTGQISDSDIVSTYPYHLDIFKEVDELRELARKYAIEVDISGASPWYPGRTVGIELEPTEETYQILRLTPPANAAFYRSSSAGKKAAAAGRSGKTTRRWSVGKRDRNQRLAGYRRQVGIESRTAREHASKKNQPPAPADKVPDASQPGYARLLRRLDEDNRQQK